MSADDLVRAAGREVNRRTVLRRIGTGALATVGMLLGLQGVASATTSLVHYKCCNLCRSPSSSCSGCVCYWCWTCCGSDSGRRNYRCCECHYADPAPCVNDCDDVRCSIAVPLSGGC